MKRPAVRMLDHLQRDINRLFEPFGWLTKDDFSDGMASDWWPSVDIEDLEDAYLVHADLPGVDPKDTDIQVANGVLTIKGERESKKETKVGKMVHIERSKGTFCRQITLKDPIDVNKITAKTKHGVLEIKLPKTLSAKTHKITIVHDEPGNR